MDQAPSISQQKRKYIEFHDPDYPGENGHSSDDFVSKRYKRENSTTTLPYDQSSETNTNVDENTQTMRHKRICKIIDREFDTEIALKKNQLDQIEKRLDQALYIFNKLRYSIVSDYYGKQEVQLNKPTVDAIRGGSQSLFSDEPNGPQLPIHPSLKKIIGKKPKSYEELMRTKPERSAAVQAKLEIQARNPALKRKERRIQKLIREQGIVIDHSKEENWKKDSALLDLKQQNGMIFDDDDDQPSTSKKAKEKAAAAALKKSLPTTSSISNPMQTATTTTVVNTSRVNNKSRFLFVIGNTSKYIGTGTEVNSSDNNQGLIYKWLVYIQGKDMQKPVETYLKKVRFHLHRSYRPHDVVDVCNPPFQIARRGWGEFQLRIQLYFHEVLHQKPVQLLHNLTLDKTHSGLHTLGSETVLEVWLRDPEAKLQELNSSSYAITNTNISNIPLKLPSPIIESSKPRTISITHNKEELDDTLFGCLSKTEMSPDIEKIQPTVVVPEQLECTLRSSPIKPMPDCSTNIQQLQQQQHINTTITATVPISSPINQVKVTHFNVPMPTSINTVNEPIRTVPLKPNLPKLITTASVTKPAIVYLQRTAQPLGSNNIFNNNNSVTAKNSNNHVKLIQMNSNGSALTDNLSVKMVRFVVNKELIKTVTMPLSLSNSQLQVQIPKQITNVTNNEIDNKQLIETQSSCVPSRSDAKKPGLAKPSVFQKEGKLYIIDPLQKEIKQAQKNQPSLLKKQSLLNQNQTIAQMNEMASRIHSIISDHNYAPAPQSVMLRKTAAATSSQRIVHTLTYNNLTSTEPTKLELDVDLMKDMQRLQLERQFQRVNFQSMREAIEFLLRRLPIIAERNTPAATFSYVRHSLREFEMLDVIKQRSTEWVRAKVVQRLLRTHRRLNEIMTVNKESFWSIRELIMFARYHAYTPIIKPINELNMADGNNAKLSQNVTPFAALVQNELKQEKQQIQYETLTSSSRLHNWVDRNTQQLQQFECKLIDTQIIEIDSIDEASKEPSRKRNLQQSQPSKTNQLYLPLSSHLSNAAPLVGDFCRVTHTKLDNMEELIPDVQHPSALTVLTHSLKLFVEKLIRRSIAARLEQQQQSHNSLSLGAPSDLVISPQDIGRVITQFTEYDFLTNSHFGVPTNLDEVNP